MLKGRVRTVRSASEFDAPDVVEDAPTLQGNAIKKAESLFALTGLPSLGDDTGLEVRALDGAPGVYSARYAGPECRPADNMTRLLRELEGAADRAAQFRTVIAFVDQDGTRLFEGICQGHILHQPRGAGGFGYDPLFLPDGESLTFAELPSSRKNAISHRGRAMQLFLTHLS